MTDASDSSAALNRSFESASLVGNSRPSRDYVKGRFGSSGREKEDPSLPFHPCMNERAHHKIARLHLPVAVRCNTRCGYCEREIAPHAVSVVAPGLSADLLSPEQALAKAREFLNRWGLNSVVGVAGPGEPLANEETFEALRLIRQEFPAITLCVCTNGLSLPERFKDLEALGVKHLTITINGFDPSVVAQIQPIVRKDGCVYQGIPAAEALIRSQIAGLEKAVKAGMVVKINCVVVPEINGAHVEDTARKVKGLGALVFNPIPLIPRGLFKHLAAPDDLYMDRLRSLCGRHVPVFRQCKQCRADAEGIPGKENAR